MERVRADGYATSMEESEEGVASVAAFLGTFAGSRYALNVSGPVARMSSEVRDDVTVALIRVT